MKVKGYFFGLNDQTPERAYQDMINGVDEPYGTAEEAKEDAELQRSRGMFVDDNAKATIYQFEISIKPVS